MNRLYRTVRQLVATYPAAVNGTVAHRTPELFASSARLLQSAR